MFAREFVASCACGSAETDGRTLRNQDYLCHHRLTRRRADRDCVNRSNLTNTGRLVRDAKLIFEELIQMIRKLIVVAMLIAPFRAAAAAHALLRNGA